MFEEYRKRLKVDNLNEAITESSQMISDSSFDFTSNAKRAVVNGKQTVVKLIQKSDTTSTSGYGDYFLQFKSNVEVYCGTYVQIETVYNSGEYSPWLIAYESSANYSKKYLALECNYVLKWRNSYGTIIERDIHIRDMKISSSKYLTNNVINETKGSLNLLIGLDEETANIEDGRRFIIDISIDGIELIKSPDVYSVQYKNIVTKITNNKGIIELGVSKTQFNKDTDSKELMIADYIPSASIPNIVEQPELESGSYAIRYNGTDNLILGANYKIFTCYYGESPIDVTWNIIDENDMIEAELTSQSIQIKATDDNKFMNKSFVLQATLNDTVVGEIKMKVVSII